MTSKKKILIAVSIVAAVVLGGFLGAWLHVNSTLNCGDGWTRRDAPDHVFDMCEKTFKF